MDPITLAVQNSDDSLTGWKMGDDALYLADAMVLVIYSLSEMVLSLMAALPGIIQVVK